MLGDDLVLLDAAHHVHDAFVNLSQIAFAQRPSAAALYVGDHRPLAVGFIDGQAGVALEPPNFDCSGCALVEERRQLAVQFVDFSAPGGNVHRSYRLSAISCQLKQPQPKHTTNTKGPVLFGPGSIIERGRLMADGWWLKAVSQILPQSRLPVRDFVRWRGRWRCR